MLQMGSYCRFQTRRINVEFKFRLGYPGRRLDVCASAGTRVKMCSRLCFRDIADRSHPTPIVLRLLRGPRGPLAAIIKTSLERARAHKNLKRLKDYKSGP